MFKAAPQHISAALNRKFGETFHAEMKMRVARPGSAHINIQNT
ncbi:hypothetical protein V5G24_17395 [Xanthobacter sp. VTT E-85241]